MFYTKIPQQNATRKIDSRASRYTLHSCLRERIDITIPLRNCNAKLEELLSSTNLHTISTSRPTELERGFSKRVIEGAVGT